MTRRFATQATALGLAIVTTLTLMSGIHQLAAPANGEDTLARTAPAQVVVITGKRIAQV